LLHIDGRLSPGCASKSIVVTQTGKGFDEYLCIQGANPKTVGYVTSGFWGGQVVGQILWGYYTPLYRPFITIATSLLTPFRQTASPLPKKNMSFMLACEHTVIFYLTLSNILQRSYVPVSDALLLIDHGFMIVIALIMNLLIWFVRSTVENAFSTGILGVVYGPMFPGSLALANDILPPEVHFVAMAIM
jgi:MFS family permease